MSALQLRSFDQRNAQNKHITKQLHKAHCAVNKLVDTGLTVVDVTITGSRPVIEIQYQTKCAHLRGISRGRRNLHNQIEEMMVSDFCHCDVVWAQPEYVNQLQQMTERRHGH